MLFKNKSLIHVALIGIKKAFHLLLKKAAPNRQIAPIGEKLCIWGINRLNAAIRIIKTNTNKIDKLHLVLLISTNNHWGTFVSLPARYIPIAAIA